VFGAFENLPRSWPWWCPKLVKTPINRSNRKTFSVEGEGEAYSAREGRGEVVRREGKKKR